jgi:hypothetical protein
MTKGPHRLTLDRYLDSAAGGVLQGAGRDWKRKAQELQTLSDALQQAAQQAELRIGEQTLTGPAMRAGMEESSASMRLKAEQLRDAGQALVVVGQQVSDTRDARDSMADLGEKPPAYQAPPGSPGVPPTDDELAAQAAASAARQQQRNAWQSDYDKQEAKSLALTKEMDAAFIAAIPPMQAIHGQEDPTEPPPHVPSGPGGPYLPGTQAPIPTGGGGGGNDDKDPTTGVRWDPQDGGRGGSDGIKDTSDPIVVTCTFTDTPVTTTPPNPTTPHVTHPIHVPETGTTTVTGTTQSGVTYQPAGPQVSSPATTGGTSGSTAAALGAAGAAGGAGGLMGAVRPGAVSSSAGSAPARAIGSTGRSGSAGALSRSAGSSASARSAGSAGSTAARSGAGSRGASSGSTSGSSSGSRSGGRGASGARGSGTGATGGRGGRKGERDKTTDRDRLVYDQDWLGDDDVAPGVLD